VRQASNRGDGRTRGAAGTQGPATYSGGTAMRVTPRAVTVVFILASILCSGAAASAAVETFQLQWGSYDVYIQPIWTNATTTVSLEPWIPPDGSATGYHLYGPTGAHTAQFGDQLDLYFHCSSEGPERCAVAGAFSFPYEGTLVVQRNYPGPGDANITLDI